MGRNSRTTERGRDAGTGQFIPVNKARQNPAKTVVEWVPKPGHGDTGWSKRAQ